MGSLNGFKITGDPRNFPVLLIFCILTKAIQQATARDEPTTTDTTATADRIICPVMLITPSFLETDFGKRAIFSGFKEAKLEHSLKARWQVTRNGSTEIIDVNDDKYKGSKLLPNLTLIISKAAFEDEGFYRFQVMIEDGWCTSNRVEIRKVRGILQHGDPCTQTRECNDRMELICSDTYKKCVCNSLYAYHNGSRCLFQSSLRANFTNSVISTTSIEVRWRDPSQDKNLIRRYILEISETNGFFSVNKSVDRQNEYHINSTFVPGHLFTVTITSVVFLNDVGKTVYIKSNVLHLVVEPLPPGAINISGSIFHPEHLQINWAVPEMNTSVDMYSITIDGYSFNRPNNFIDWPYRLEPGTKYKVTIKAVSCWNLIYEKRSDPYYEEITTIRTPKVVLSSSPFYHVPYLSNLKANASIQNPDDFPPLLEVKWQKIRRTTTWGIGTAEDIDISLNEIKGSTIDKSYPLLLINGVTFDDKNDYISYRCLARNSEGWGTSENATITVIGSVKYNAPCNESRECLYNSDMHCQSGKCRCYSSYYQRNSSCYSRSNLKAHTFNLTSFFCEDGVGFSLQWKEPYRDKDLVNGYNVSWREQTISYNNISDPENVGMNTAYKTPCSLNFQSGRLYWTTVRTLAVLTNPTEEIFVDESPKSIIIDPLQPGPIIKCNRSPDDLYFTWERSSTSFVNRYKVTIDNKTQNTTGYEPEIRWKYLLMPSEDYEVTIIAVSYGYTTNYPTYGTKESAPSINHIKTTLSKYSGKVGLPYGEKESDFILQNKETSEALEAPMTVYVGDGSDGGFKSVYIGFHGVIGLGDKFKSPNALDLHSPSFKGKKILCPFSSELKSEKIGKVYYKTYSRQQNRADINETFMEKADNIIKAYFKDFKGFKANWLVKVTWENMTVGGSKKEKKITFQTFLISDGENTFAVYNYVDVNLPYKHDLKISVGYRFGNTIVQKRTAKHKSVFRMSDVPGNGGGRGFWIYKLTKGVRTQKEAGECRLWYNYNRDNKIGQQLLTNNIECPCSSRLLQFDPRFAISRLDTKNRLLCYASILVDINAECCFKMYADIDHLGPLQLSKPLAGTMLKYNPFMDQNKYNNNDSHPRDACCSTEQCDLFYEVRPIPTCYSRSPFVPAGTFGDPHITTLDGKLYTFNGYGEYTLMKIETGTTTFELQSRTELASSQNGTKSNATVFSAFVAKDQTGASIQVEMARNKKSMIIKANGRDLTKQFQNSNYTLLTTNISIRWDNGKISALFLKPLITVKISLGKNMLLSDTLVNKQYKGSVKGKSLFQYDDGLTFRDFYHPEFVPMFLDEVDESRLNDAKAKCGLNPSASCISDYLATGDIEVALSSGKSEETSNKNIAELENESPQISGNTTINAHVNKTVKFKFEISDDGKTSPRYVVLKQPDHFVLDNRTGIATWTPINDDVSEISILAEDDMGVQSPALDVTLNLCSGCSNHGNCDFDNLPSSGETGFHKIVCDCDQGYTGDNCESEVDACLEMPCSLNRQCTDLSPEEESVLGRGYNCSACPPGYDTSDDSCSDVDECLSKDNNNCNATVETCENTEGGYICQCLPGYKKIEDKCRDIDECLTGTSRCEQLCQNTPGSFTCSCFLGYTLKSDHGSCVKADNDPCKDFPSKCEYTCSNKTGKIQCDCPLGYELASNGISCKDINECELPTSPCEEGCVNTEGSFNCTCRPGYYLSQDKTSCKGCEPPNYGNNCSKLCECGPGGDRCDAVSGCVCLSGWTGENCDEDVDECTTDPFICGSNRLCKNLEGSYLCGCEDGFQLMADKCEDIDECSDVSLNDCPKSTTFCRNAYGSYSCECQEGFQTKNGACEDINECETGVHPCSQMCINVDGGYNCGCYYGFTLGEDRENCERVKDMCALFPGLNCSYGCRRGGHDPASGICFCESGYQLDSDGKTCNDINECNSKNKCAHNCTNTKGSFKCGCAVGYKLQNDGISCEPCGKFFYGENCETPCKCGRGSKTCDNIKGCVCESGWTGESCEQDVDECQSNPCPGHHDVCVNTPGSYRCECPPGFRKINGFCRDIDECQDSSICPQKCNNTVGSYKCACNHGFKLENEKDCVDINECLDTKCHDCENSPGSFKCLCNEGFIIDPITQKKCNNINECSDGSHTCSSYATCTDTIGSYTCKCPDKGFKGDGHKCTVCDNFTYGEQCSKLCACNRTNAVGCDAVSGECTCNSKWEGRDCSVDIDECKRGTKICGSDLHVCVNTPGSAICECRYGGTDLNNCVQPKAGYSTNETETKVKVEVRFDINVQRQKFLNDSVTIVEEFEKSLNAFYEEENVDGFHLVKVLSAQFGSLIIDYEIIGSLNKSVNFTTELAKCMTYLLHGKIKLMVLHHIPTILHMTIKDQSGLPQYSISPLASPCYVMHSFGYSCLSGEKCIDSSGIAKCVKDSSDKDLSTFLIVLGVTIPFSVVVIAIVACWIYHHKTANRVQVIDISDSYIQKMKFRREYTPPTNYNDDSRAYGAYFGQVPNKE
uniref:Uncharacterized protein n=2 Tax=Magallana gigas TaxID=29159 RepID=A0A8W8MTE0_MAGGI